jgi:hypothetical protein
MFLFVLYYYFMKSLAFRRILVHPVGILIYDVFFCSVLFYCMKSRYNIKSEKNAQAERPSNITFPHTKPPEGGLKVGVFETCVMI